MLSTKLVKPSSPTYTVKRFVIYCYSTDSNSGKTTEGVERRINRLQTSLSETLTRFYPLDGRYVKDIGSIMSYCEQKPR